MSTNPVPLMDENLFPQLERIIPEYGIRVVVETGTGPRSSGMVIAQHFGLQGYTCDVYEPCARDASERFPDFQVYHSDSLAFLRDCLPKITEPTFFWLDAHCPTDHSNSSIEIFPLYEEMTLIRAFKPNFAKDVIWIDDIAMIIDPANPTATSWNMDLAGRMWHGDTSHQWDEYLAVFADTHDWEIDEKDCVLKLTPKG